MIYRLLSIVAVLTLVSSAHARLGESEDQLEARFGKPVKGHPNLSDAAFVFSQLSSTLYFGPLQPEQGVMDILERWDWTGFTFKAYTLEPYQVLVLLKDGKSVFEEVRDSTATQFDSTKLDALLTANAGGLTWRMVPTEDETIRQWFTTDPQTKVKTRFAVSNGGSSIGFYTAELVQFLNKKASEIKAGKETKNTEATKKF
jgi:hypothetical protein